MIFLQTGQGSEHIQRIRQSIAGLSIIIYITTEQQKEMIEYIKGELIEITPADATVECHGIGYHILISLQTFTQLEKLTDVKVYIHHYLREDEELYYGFATKEERELFRLLIGVSGIGAATARMMLSSLTSEEIRNAIIAEDINRIKSIKGIGLKSAQRLILELKDKIVKGAGNEVSIISGTRDNAVAEEAVTALVLLGFTKANVNKAVSSVLKDNPDANIESVIKLALKKL